MDHGGIDAVAIEAFGDSFGAALGARKDQAAAGFFAEQLVQHGVFAIGGDFESLQAHVFGGLEGGTEGQTDGISGEILH